MKASLEAAAAAAAFALSGGIATMAHAYFGPGAGITAIGTVIALIGAVLLAIVGFIWYPIKRLRARRAARRPRT